MVVALAVASIAVWGRLRRGGVGLFLLVACGTGQGEPPPAAAPPPVAAQAPPAYLKGQLHLHSGVSGDSDTPPGDVASWYAAHGYDFIVFTDHNRITEVPATDGMLVMAGIELTWNAQTCVPEPEPGLQCLLHVNGVFVDPQRAGAIESVPPPTNLERKARFNHAADVTRALGGIPILNHPNFHYAADADVLASFAGFDVGFFEVANEAVDSNNGGDETHPSTEELWDRVLSRGAKLYGVATDDAHHYEDALQVRAAGEVAHVGDRGWVMVRAERDPTSIRRALERGDFYSTNGVLLDSVDRVDGRLHVVVSKAVDPVRIVFIGEEGRELARVQGREGTAPDVESAYVRAVVIDGANDRAWVQPVW